MKLLLIGLDGADPDLIVRFIEAGHLPNLQRLIKQGQFGPLCSTRPPTTFPAWTSLFTGQPPSFHGVTDFTVKQGYKVRFIGGNQRMVPTFCEVLEQAGFSTGAAWFPASYPPTPKKGYQISGWDSPVTDRGDASFVTPTPLHQELLTQFGKAHLRFNAVDEFSHGVHQAAQMVSALERQIDDRTAMALYLMKHHPTDLAAFYFGETDTVAHHFFAHFDAQSPRHPDHCTTAQSQAMLRVYQAADRAVGRLRAAAPEATLMVVSDHGSGGNSTTAVYINRFLQQAGLLTFRAGGSALPNLRNLAGRLVPTRLRRPLFKAFRGALPALIESSHRFKNIDFSNTALFSEELPYAPSIWINQLGREPEGTVRYRDRHQIESRLRQAARAWCYQDGTPVIRKIIPRAKLHQGPLAHRFPDFNLELTPIDQYAAVALSSNGKTGPTIRTLTQTECLGRKGESMPGAHRQHGIYLSNDPALPLPDQIDQVANNIYDLFDVWAPEPQTGELPLSHKGASPYTGPQQKVVMNRLAQLGYLDE